MSNTNWKKSRAEAEILKYEKEQMEKNKRVKIKKMETYDDKDIDDINFTKYKIVVPTKADKISLELAFEHLHYSDCDANNVPVNQLIHEYLTEDVTGDPKTINNIIVDPKMYKKLNDE